MQLRSYSRCFPSRYHLKMAKPPEKMRALRLRREGKSIKDIAFEIGVSPRTVSVWVRNLILTKAQRNELRKNQIASGNSGRLLGAVMNHKKKLERISRAQAEAAAAISEISFEALFYLGLGLYWGEGSKTESSSLAVTNADPRMIRLMIRWFTECMQIEKERFMPRIFISKMHHDRAEVILDYWAQELNISAAQFKRTVFLPRGKKIYENRDMYYGVLALRVAKGGQVRTKILSYIERITEVSSLNTSA